MRFCVGTTGACNTRRSVLTDSASDATGRAVRPVMRNGQSTNGLLRPRLFGRTLRLMLRRHLHCHRPTR